MLEAYILSIAAAVGGYMLTNMAERSSLMTVKLFGYGVGGLLVAGGLITYFIVGVRFGEEYFDGRFAITSGIVNMLIPFIVFAVYRDLARRKKAEKTPPAEG
jgi:ABC-type spermidine/putrescine transport system permease subunit I